jgi:prepilin-type N-terminal cleavage/methylation domain-containing protein
VKDSGCGFSLVEILVAMAIMAGVMAAVFAMLAPSQPMFAAQGEGVDIQQRMRVAAETLMRDLSMSGAGAFPRGEIEPLTRVLAPLAPAWPDPGDIVSGSRADTVRLVFAPPSAAQATTATVLPARSGSVLMAEGPACATGAAPCGFVSRARVLVYDAAGFHDLFTVTSADGAVLQLRHDLPDTGHVYPAGSALVEVTSRTYSLRRDSATGTDQLVRTDAGSAAPVVDHVVGLSFEYFGDPEPPRVTGVITAGARPSTTYGPRPPPPDVSSGSFPPGENCVFAYAGAYVPRLARLDPADGVLAPLTNALLSDGPWCPDALHPARFDADLFRVRRVLVRLRVQSAVDSLRGPAGMLFMRPGTARDAARMVPDLEATFQVAPGNLGVPY